MRRRLRWLLFWHEYGTPESTVHRVARVLSWRIHHFWSWKLPKRFGLDRCTECGSRPCGTKLGGEWRCPIHSVFVSEGHHPVGLRVIKGGKR